MQTLWMGVRPGPDLTRLLVQDGPIPILKARLPEAPHHPRALETLAEGVALWYGRPLYAALGVAAEDALCGRVEDERGGVQDRRRRLRAASFVVALAEKSIAPFLVPAHRTGRDHFGHPALGRVSRAAFAGASRGSRSRDRTPSSPNTALMGNCRYPGPASLCRRRRKRRTVWYK